MPRAATASAAGVAVLMAAALAGSRAPATAAGIDELRARARQVGDEVSRLEHRRAELDATAETLDRAILRTSQRLGVMELELRAAEKDHDRATRRFVSRAIETYKNGPTSQLVMFLSARSLNDAYDVAEAAAAAARLDARALEELVETRASAETAQANLQQERAKLVSDRARALDLATQIATTIEDRRSMLRELNHQVAALEEQARRVAARATAPSQALRRLLQPAGPSKGIPAGFVSTGVGFEGLASWYGHSWDGQATASGDIFDADLMTAASKELPLGTWLYVEYNGRGVVVLVNDRGPYVEPRILDLSLGAAKAIGMVSAGVGWVKAEILVKEKQGS